MEIIEFSRKDIRRESRADIKGNFISLYAANLLAQILIGISIFLRQKPVIALVVFILTSVLEFGIAKLYLMYESERVIYYSDIFITYRQKSIRRFLSHLMTFIAKYVIILLSATLLLIPGLIKRYSYSQVDYIRVTFPDIGFIRCLMLSKRMMRWHKMEMFILELTLVVWFLLIPLTGGLILIYFQPYYATIKAKYHRYLRSRYDLNRAVNRNLVGYFVRCLNKLN